MWVCSFTVNLNVITQSKHPTCSEYMTQDNLVNTVQEQVTQRKEREKEWIERLKGIWTPWWVGGSPLFQISVPLSIPTF